jgi:molybdate transport system substrate-binding protein
MSRRLLAVAAAAGVLLAGCGSPSRTPAAPAAAGSAVSGTVTVFAAASLKEAFTRLGRQFEAAHPGVRVVLSFGPSSGLATQITQGAPADVFASASTTSMQQVVKAGDASAPRDFASNVMQIAVPPANPAHVTGVADLARAGVKVAVCQAAVPCGSTAAKVFTRAAVKVTPVTQEVDVKAVLAKVILGEVDAGVVYVTDVRAAGAKVRGIAIPASVNASTTYPVAPVAGSRNPAAAKAFTDYVLSAEGVAALTAAGFARP